MPSFSKMKYSLFRCTRRTTCPRFTRALVAPGEKILVALSNVFADLRVAEFQIIFELLGAHDADDWNAVLFQNEVFLIQVHAPYDLPEVHACFGDWKTMYHGIRFHQDCSTLIKV